MDKNYGLIKKVFSFNYAKNRIIYRLVNVFKEYPDNLDILTKELPNTTLKMEFVIDYSVDSSGEMVIPIDKCMLNIWGDKTEDYIFKLAIKNTPVRRGFYIRNIDDILGFDSSPFKMIVVTNEMKTYGAGVILYPDVYNAVCKFIGGDIYILPSSVHEVICVSKTIGNIEELFEMVSVINRDLIGVNEKDFLSDDVLEFRNGKLCSAFTNSGTEH